MKWSSLIFRARHAVVFSSFAFICGTGAATLTVTTNSDSGPASLRERIDAAGIGDTIVFASTVVGSITLTSGDLVLRRDTFIDGPGPNLLSVVGSGTNGVFQIVELGQYRISGLVITGGRSWTGRGGGIYNFGTLTVSNCTIHNNRPADGPCGGCVGRGGGIYNDGTLTVINSTISSNQATVGGGIINNLDTSRLTIINSTISGNFALSGGGILTSGPLALTNCTIAGNWTDTTGSSGAGVNVNNRAVPAIVRNTIIANNYAASFAATADVLGAFNSQGYNLIGTTNGSTGFGATGDQLGNNGARLDPRLGGTRNNGGSTPTRALLPGSPAIDQGHSSGFLIDQRGAPRPFDQSFTNAAGGDGSDIGAFEVGGLVRLSIYPLEGDDLWLVFNTDLGPSYDLERTDDLMGSWIPVKSNVAGTGGLVGVIDSRAAQLPEVFYRVRFVP